MKRTLLVAALLLPIVVVDAGCGTLIFPKRRNQEAGNVDPNVIAMDAFWLLFYVLPGLFAFGVDIATGAIYLPPGVERGEGPFLKD